MELYEKNFLTEDHKGLVIGSNDRYKYAEAVISYLPENDVYFDSSLHVKGWQIHFLHSL